MPMTKKDFIALADAVRAHNDNGKPEFTAEHLETLAEFCRFRSPAFKAYRWVKYVRGELGPNGGAI